MANQGTYPPVMGAVKEGLADGGELTLPLLGLGHGTGAGPADLEFTEAQGPQEIAASRAA